MHSPVSMLDATPVEPVLTAPVSPSNGKDPSGTSSPLLWLPLDWDRQHFGIRIGRLQPEELSLAELIVQLARAARENIDCLYWFANRPLSGLQSGLPGWTVVQPARQVTLAKELPADEVPAGVTVLPDEGTHDTVIEPLSLPLARNNTLGDDADRAAITSLGIDAGWTSRFRRDPNFATERVDALYRIWADKCLTGERANAVLIARRRGQVAGLITLQVTGAARSSAEIGLVAVQESARGLGLGRRLMRAAERWLQAQGVNRVTVVTQAENSAAISLYRRCGYQEQQQRTVYHFWRVAESAAC